MKINTRGFTLIELLVVIAIIGILSSVVLVSLNSARSKGNDAKIQSTLSGIRSAAEVFYTNSGTYVGMYTDSVVKPYIDSLTAMSVTTVSTASSTGYAISAPLAGNAGKSFCVDGVGHATTTLTTSVDSTGELSDVNGCE